MRAWVRPFLAILLALALVAGGAGRFAVACDDDPATARPHSHTGHHHSHDHDAAKNDHDAAKKPLSAPGCLKCCGICIADPALARAPAVVADLQGRPAIFSTAGKTYRDRPVVLDPGIPKPIV